MIKPGDLIDDKYHVLRILGEGGMGVVVEARDMKLDALVAIKFMKAEVLADRETVERFLLEARALARLKSQHAVKVYYLGTFQGMPFIVMEHLEGVPLNRYLDQRGSLPPGEAAWYLSQACEAIAEAHSEGIFHRDIKPANMYLAKGPSGKTILKVLDFGIAKMVKQVDDTMRKGGGLTGTYTIMGTPMYMSPEQWRATRDVDWRSDIWSLGVVLYELVTGELPFEGTGPYELQKAIIEEQPARRQMPAPVEAIVERCLFKDRHSRYQSVDELAVALQQVISQPAISAVGPIVQQNAQQTTGGGTVRINPSRTITVPPPAAQIAPDTLSEALTRRVDSSSKSPAPRNRVFAIAAAGVVAMLMLVGTVIFGIQAALSDAAAPIASASTSPPAPSADSIRAVIQNDSVNTNTPTNTLTSSDAPVKAEVSAPIKSLAPRDTPTNVHPTKTAKTSSAPAPSPTLAKTVTTRHEQ